jgi:hypothetical protein
VEGVCIAQWRAVETQLAYEGLVPWRGDEAHTMPCRFETQRKRDVRLDVASSAQRDD